MISDLFFISLSIIGIEPISLLDTVSSQVSNLNCVNITSIVNAITYLINVGAMNSQSDVLYSFIFYWTITRFSVVFHRTRIVMQLLATSITCFPYSTELTLIIALIFWKCNKHSKMYIMLYQYVKELSNLICNTCKKVCFILRSQQGSNLRPTD